MKPKLIQIYATDMNGLIGIKQDNKYRLPFYFKKDLEHFKSITTGNNVVMGINTWDSLPIKPLPNRDNYVLSNYRTIETETNNKAYTIGSLSNLRHWNNDTYIIGGKQIYEQTEDWVDEIIVTKVPLYIDINQEQEEQGIYYLPNMNKFIKYKSETVTDTDKVSGLTCELTFEYYKRKY